MIKDLFISNVIVIDKTDSLCNKNKIICDPRKDISVIYFPSISIMSCGVIDSMVEV